jgi:mono/diheme cytochrome c family protein
MLRITVWTTAMLAGAALAGCGGGGGGGAEEGGADVARYEGPIASNDVARGQEVYDDVCMACHAGGAPSLDGIGWDAARMRHQIREGSGRMPAMPLDRLSDEDMEAALAYMVTIGAVTAETAGVEPTSGGAAEPLEDADADTDEAVEEGG